MDFAPFISGWYINQDTCDKLIDLFENHPHKFLGVVGGDRSVDVSRKDSMDMTCHATDDHPLIQEYLSELKIVLEKYIERYPWCSNRHQPWSITNGFNIQRYYPDQGFHVWHFERNATAPLRHLVFMTYLNDVTDGGETEWYHQQVLVQPKKGLTVFWPADWTFVHRGLTSTTQTKYIVTGWYCYDNNESGN